MKEIAIKSTKNIFLNCKYIAFTFFVFLNIYSKAQTLDLIKFGSAYYPKQSINDSNLNGKIGFFEWFGQFTIPQTFKNSKTILIHKIGYANLCVDYNVMTNSTYLESENTYHSISYSLGIVKPLKQKWQIILNINPSLASDFGDRLSTNDLLFQANGFALLEKKTNIKYGFGLAFTNRFGREIIIPTLLVKYAKPKMTLDILLPLRVKILFQPKSDLLRFGLEALLNGGIFNNSYAPQISDVVPDEIGYSRINIGPIINFRLKKLVNIYFAGGLSTARKLEFVNESEDTLDRTPDVGPYIRFGFSLSPEVGNINKQQ